MHLSCLLLDTLIVQQARLRWGTELRLALLLCQRYTLENYESYAQCECFWSCVGCNRLNFMWVCVKQHPAHTKPELLAFASCSYLAPEAAPRRLGRCLGPPLMNGFLLCSFTRCNAFELSLISLCNLLMIIYSVSLVIFYDMSPRTFNSTSTEPRP